jgi:hypothetical protein
VYLDANGNGEFDRDEQPLSGVVVSDMLDAVRSDKAGA